ncbi:hypothetical protein BCV70DRAFT_205082 [Testicularia cyperi]|uniref:Uncharacterized protein n=1 Tax=Testicularia cyperi TaxID=1882483 RepID=A0A317XTP6_9BASI|nr:hypothetical protein BCV70DRAFT_205082 [Testicularia cyperi]
MSNTINTNTRTYAAVAASSPLDSIKTPAASQRESSGPVPALADRSFPLGNSLDRLHRCAWPAELACQRSSPPADLCAARLPAAAAATANNADGAQSLAEPQAAAARVHQASFG